MMRYTIFTILFALLFTTLTAQNTYLDSSFNDTGIRKENISGHADYAKVMLTRPNGKSLILGSSNFDQRIPPNAWSTETIRVGVAQFDLNSQPDSTFGDNGKVVWGGAPGTFAFCRAAALQTDGKLLITGNFEGNAFVIRLHENGSIDSTFGENGIVQNLYHLYRTFAIANQEDGKILVGGGGEDENSLSLDFILYRLNPNGSIDTGFGTNGYVITDYAFNFDEIYSIAVLEDGSITASGSTTGSLDYPMLVRYNQNGELDPNFGQNGIVVRPYTGYINKMLVQPNAKVIVAGGSSYSNGFVERLNEDGTVDNNFESIILGERITGLVSLPNNQVQVSTFDDNFVADSVRIAMYRYLSNGSLDPGFYPWKMLPQYFRFDAGMNLQPDGKLILGGDGPDRLISPDFFLLRLTQDGVTDIAYGQNGLASQNVGEGLSTAISVFTDAQNRILLGGKTSNTGFIGRLTAEGKKDESFANDGLVAVNGSVFSQQTDEKILSAGGRWYGEEGFVLSRILANGNADTLFGAYHGYSEALFNFSSSILSHSPIAILQKPDGKFLVLGRAELADGNKIAMALFKSNGLVDSVFAINGIKLSNPGAGDYQLNCALIQSDGKWVVAGTYYASTGANPKTFLIRYLTDGDIDLSFGTNGIVLNPFPLSVRVNSIVLQSDERILVAGNSGVPNNETTVIGRLNTEGKKDLSFNGIGFKSLNTASNESIKAIAIQPDGKIVATGVSAASTEPEAYDPMILRLQANGKLDSTFGNNGFLITEITGHNEPKSIAIQSDGNYLVAGFSDNDYLLIRYLRSLNVGVVTPADDARNLMIYPNPVHSQAMFEYVLPSGSLVSLDLLDLQGRSIHTFILQEYREMGENKERIFFPANLPTGAYMLRMRTESGVKSVQILVNKP